MPNPKRHAKSVKLLERIKKHVVIKKLPGCEAPGPCWIWAGSTGWMRGRPDQPYGYMVASDNQRLNVRRLSYVLHDCRPRLENFIVESICGNSLCVNPDHLRRGTRRKRGSGKE